MAPPFEFPVQVVQKQIRQQRGQWSTLRRPLVPIDAHAVLQHPRFQETANDAQQALVANAPGQPRHQDVVVHPVEEFLQIEIDHDWPPLAHKTTGLRQRIVRPASGPKAKA